VLKHGVVNAKIFNLANISSASKCAGGLAKWCQALYKYAQALKVVRPKE